MITRTIYFKSTSIIECCRDGVITYSPASQDHFKIKSITKDNFNQSLNIWRDKIIKIYEDEIYEKAEIECKKGVSRNLCKFNIDSSNTSVEETGEPEEELDIEDYDKLNEDELDIEDTIRTYSGLKNKDKYRRNLKNKKIKQ